MTELKTCTKCQIEKPIGEFAFRKDTGKLRGHCKTCTSERSVAYNATHKERLKELNILWRKNNPEKSNAIYVKYRKTEKRRTAANKYAKKNRKKQQEYFVERYHNNPQFNAAIKFRRRIFMAIKNQFTSKAYKTLELLGCSYSEFERYFKAQFTEGMTWDKFMNGEIHIDHRTPCVAFDLTDPSQQLQCFNFTNLQPLWAIENIKKGAMIDRPFQPSLLLRLSA